MDIFRFINSKDIREHLKNINYRFNSLEAAWLIYRWRDATIREKHEAWNELIQTMPDCPIARRLNTVKQESLHEFLKQYMELEDKYVEQFCRGGIGSNEATNAPSYVYSLTYLYPEGDHDGDAIFSDFDMLRKAADIPDEEMIGIWATMRELNKETNPSTALLTPEFEFLSISPWPISGFEYNVFYGVFDGFWFDIPTPFKKGDIVWNPVYPDGRKALFGGPMVFEQLITDDLEPGAYVRHKGDCTDMTYYGYFLNPDEGIYKECNSNYMDLEYYRKELMETERALIPISEFLKGEIGLDYCCQKYHKVFSEKAWLDGQSLAYEEYKKSEEYKKKHESEVSK